MEKFGLQSIHSRSIRESNMFGLIEDLKEVRVEDCRESRCTVSHKMAIYLTDITLDDIIGVLFACCTWY